ncbi:MAG TPA: cytidylate kinase family protein [Pirellulales bacterium]|nr:cytidylate kinase family protein [Pirellulales bacterium]
MLETLNLETAQPVPTLTVSGLPWYVLRQIARERDQSSARQGPRLGPYIVVSRHMGAGGDEMAELLGGQFGWPVLDKQLVDLMAERFHVDHDVVEMLDENKSSTLYEALGHFVNHRLISQQTYVCYLRRIVASVVAAGPAVFVGRGVQFFLPRRHGLAVRVVADERDRIDRISRRYGLSKTEAKRIMIETHDRWSAFVRCYFHKDLDDPANYDLVVNTSRLGVEAAAELVVATFRSRHIDAPG